MKDTFIALVAVGREDGHARPFGDGQLRYQSGALIVNFWMNPSE